MDNRNAVNVLALVGLCLCSVLISAIPDIPCPGPLKHYAEIGCTPIFNDDDSECAQRFDCDHLKDLPADKCFINGHTYEIGEPLRDEDLGPCDFECVCSPGSRGPKFECAQFHCIDDPPNPGCYLERHPLSCCPGPENCPKDPADRPTCLVDGKIYRDGEYFEPRAEPQKRCYCGPGYTGENIEPYCISTENVKCGTLLHNIDDVRKNCAPVYDFNELPSESCSSMTRCQSDKDVVVRWTFDSSSTSDPDMLCKLGNLTMRVGDEINEEANENSQCVQCMCEVPPVPTCFLFADDDCKIINNLTM